MTIDYRRAPVRTGLAVGTALVLLLAWEIAALTDVIPTRFAPSPSQILGELGGMIATSALWSAIGATLYAWAQALALAVTAGTAIGLALGSSRYFSALFGPILDFLKPIPSIAMIPLVIFTIGSGKNAEVFLATYGAFFQMLMSSISATRMIDPVGRDTADAYSFGFWTRLRYVIVPSMLPQLMTGIRIASNTALIFCITAELLMGMAGLGSALGAAGSAGNLTVMYAYIVVIGIVGFSLNTGLLALQKRILSWHESYRNEAA
ncbi:ABC transporter permease [Flaviflexus equikiangi]|uniref:ABC transporter permease n=1 Tax=Flaviflexus equikiangi TaxID=2758573 RepID=A0ABS2TCN0_9ACTO|nr:ABC transporter permease [Flaviflexus equikiangi]MBM9432410.1 ABC transporter permease [Flaviflexus equikiangi]